MAQFCIEISLDNVLCVKNLASTHGNLLRLQRTLSAVYDS